MPDPEIVRGKFEALRRVLDERAQRLWAACEARSLGYGGISLVAAATGLCRPTIRQGLEELQRLEQNPAAALPVERPQRVRRRPVFERGRIRRPGGGRKLTEVKDSGILPALESLLSDEVAGDPMGEQKWLRSSMRHLSQQLKQAGHEASPGVVARLLKTLGFSLKTNKRRVLRKTCPGRDEQFRYIASQRQAFSAAGLPVISVDTKKKELIGDFRNSGQTWCRKAPEVDEHDYPSAAECQAVPFGIYDVARNAGYVVVGTSNNTPEFAVRSIARWWEAEGRVNYPAAARLLVLADGGGGNGSRSRGWKVNLQAKVCDRFGLTITVCHYPPGCSKWNPVEHRLFSYISVNWAGKPLRSLRVMLGYIRGTTTRTGLKVTAVLDDATYRKGQKASREQVEALGLRRHEVCPQWNYTLSPRAVSVSGRP
jgi:hypothetical protein